LDSLRKHFCDLQAENRVLAVISAKLQQTLHTNTQQLQDTLSKKIADLEEYYIAGQSELKLAKLILNKNLPMCQFTSDVRGVLLIKRVKPLKAVSTPQIAQPIKETNKYKWKKRWILLHDNFLLCYKADAPNEPVLALRLHDYKILPIAERDIGRKFCFQITTPTQSYYFAAANPKVLLKWLNCLAQVSPWYLTDTPFFTNNERGERTSSAPFIRPSLMGSDPVAPYHSSSVSAFPGIPLRAIVDETATLQHSSSDSAFPGIPLRAIVDESQTPTSEKRKSRGITEMLKERRFSITHKA